MPPLSRIKPLFMLASLVLAAGLLGAPLAAHGAQDSRRLEILDFYLYPDDRTEQSRSEFAFPEQQRISAAVKVRTEGIENKDNLSIFLVLFDSQANVLDKHKARFMLPAGTHELVLNDILLTSDVMADQELLCKIEVSLKGAQPAKQQLSLSVQGPQPPRVTISDMLIYNPSLGRQSSTFDPGDNFEMEASIEISDNPSRMAPTLLLYAVMDEDSYDTDPYESYQPFNENWDRLKMSAGEDGLMEGLYAVKASGRMPRFFSQPYEAHHELRIYAIIDWGLPEPGKLSEQAVEDYAEAEVFDFYPGESRNSQELRDRLIELNRAYTWELTRKRTGEEAEQ